MLQQGAGDLTLPLVLNEHDGTINSNAVNVIVENFNAAARVDEYTGNPLVLCIIRIKINYV